MVRNTVTTAGELQTGDRFYKVNDNNKEVWQIIERLPSFQTSVPFAIRDSDTFPSPLKKETAVVFLRHTD